MIPGTKHFHFTWPAAVKVSWESWESGGESGEFGGEFGEFGGDVGEIGGEVVTCPSPKVITQGITLSLAGTNK